MRYIWFSGDANIDVEIGVYHGRSFLPLCALRNAGETLVAIDCFDQQEFNVDESGVGNYNKFVSNICRVCGAIKEEDEEFWDGARDASGELPSWLHVIKGNSLVMSAMEIIQAAGIKPEDIPSLLMNNGLSPKEREHEQ